MNAYRKWLKGRIDELTVLQEWEPDDALWDHASLIVSEAARRAATLGLTNLVEASLSLPKLVNCYTAVGFLSTCVAKAVEQPKFLTPPQAAKEDGCDPEKIIAWIRSGELVARNMVSDQNKKPRYRIDRAEWEAFKQRRATTAVQKPKQPRRAPQYQPKYL